VDEALDELKQEEFEPKLKKNKAPLQMMSYMVEVTPANARMAKDYAADEIADRKEKKKIDAASIPTKKRNKEESISKKELEQAPGKEEGDKEEPKMKKKKVAAPIFTLMVEVTSDEAKAASDYANQMLAK
jgi:stress response protein SCP2